MSTISVPLFPLNTVLFPDGPLPLRIFEPRYLQMVSRCLKDDCEFGVLLITDGAEVGEVRTREVGTLARITDWYQGSDGILGVTARGGRRFRLMEMSRQADGLYVGEITPLPEPGPRSLPAEYEPMAVLLATVIEDLGRLYEAIDKRYGEAGWVGCRFAEILPMPPADKQHCLEIDDPLERLQFLRPMLRPFRRERTQ